MILDVRFSLHLYEIGFHCWAVHALRLLSTHHIFRETAPDTFALTRVASLLDSGKSVNAVFSKLVFASSACLIEI